MGYGYKILTPLSGGEYLKEEGGGGVGGMLFSIVNEIYEYYKAQSAISLFQINELFSQHFWGFKLEIFNPRNVRNPIRFPDLLKRVLLDLSNRYINDCR